MKIEALSFADAWVLTPDVHGDDRGFFLEWLRTDKLEAATGRRFEARQANHSLSARGVARGIHYTDVPPGQAKLIYCPKGAVLDVIVDIRVGSPTFGQSDTVVLSGTERRAVFISEGLGHGFCALEDDTSIVYLVSTTYDPSTDRSIDPLDSELALPWPFDSRELVISEKDRNAPSLAEAGQRGLLPDVAACAALYRELTVARPS